MIVADGAGDFTMTPHGDDDGTARAIGSAMHHRRFVAAAFAALIGGGCSWPMTTCISATPPRAQAAPPYHFVEDARLISTMQRLANDIIELDRTMNVEPRRQQDVLAVLDDLQGAIAKISSPGQSTNHPRLDAELDRFALDVANVRAEVARTPPVYASAWAVPTMCLRCHGGH